MAGALRLQGLDGVAITLSGLCLVHCLALPVLAITLPFLGVFAEAEWVHWLFVALAVPASALALLASGGQRSWPLVLGATLGLGLLAAGAAGWPDHDLETVLTVSGGLVLATVHALNWRRARQAHARS
ncbi:MAG: MerC domain-containing protein [Caulobacteraceae bacterium]|nr:MerC domain-containing protein [Caulobacteraceae bacterium]